MKLDTTIQEWLEQLGEPVAETAFPPRDENGKPTKLPSSYLVFLDEIETDGCDESNLYSAHDLTIERYHPRGDNRKLECFLWKSGLHFRRGPKQWLPSEQTFMTPYYITDLIFTKNGVEKNGEYTD